MRITPVLLLIPLLGLMACSGDGVKVPAGQGENDRWVSITDPGTNRSFRCFTMFRTYTNVDGKVTGGPSMFCYENKETP